MTADELLNNKMYVDCYTKKQTNRNKLKNKGN